MSTSFEIYPTNKKTPNCNEIIRYSVQLFSEYLKENKISRDINIIAKEVTDDEVYINPDFLVLEKSNFTAFNLNEEGEVYVYYHELTELDKEFWDEEIKVNKNAQLMKEKIDANREIGYFWSVKRTMGQPPIVGLYYGYLAIAIAVLTDGIIYSWDGAWDYSILPIEGKVFKTEYLNIENINDVMEKDTVKQWLDMLKNRRRLDSD